MIKKITLPHLGEIIEQAVLLRWLKERGETIAAGEPLLEVTADKATLVVESPASGSLLHCCAGPGELIPVDGVIALFGTTEDAVPPNIRDIRYPKAPADSCLQYRQRLDTPRPTGNAQPLDAMRTVVAERMTQSKTAAPHFYLQTRIDMASCIALRQRLKQKEKVRVSYNDMILKAAALTVAKYPRVAAAYSPGGYLPRESSHIGFAVAVEPDGLLVPVIRNCGELPLRAVSAQARDLASRARNHQLRPEEYTGGVFTVSNLGSFEVETFTAIINPGESAILAVGKIQETPVVVEGAVAVRPTLIATLSSDHRVVDGVLAARFNSTLKSLLESPDQLL